MNNFYGTYTQKEIESAQSLAAEELYQPYKFDRNNISAYAEALVELDMFPLNRVTAARHIAWCHGINQDRLLDLYLILS